jgi:ATP-dependent protease HslVU (ClpYQ) peptidase subunit
MTCILAVRNTNNRIILAGDRRITADDEIYTMPQAKITKKNDVLLGVCGDAGLCQLILNNLRVPIPFNDTAKYVNFAFINSIKNLLKQQPFDITESDVLLIVNQEAWIVEIDVTKEDQRITYNASPTEIPVAIGTGAIATRAAYLASSETNTKKRIQHAFDITASMLSSVDNQIDLIQTD